MSKRLFTILLAVISAGLLFGAISYYRQLSPQPAPDKPASAKPLDKYSIPALQKTTFQPSDVTIGKPLDLGVASQAYQFFYSDNFAPEKRISGTIMLPPQPGRYSVLLMLRGWADEEVYYPGYGTKNAASYFAQQGYITIAPDFLGYGDSDPYSGDFAEARFQMYTSALTLLASVENFGPAMERAGLNTYSLDTDRLGMWGHSNGGQVALTVLAVTKRPIPTVLWAPVTLQLPDNILHYAADQPDGGRLIRALVRNFESSYDVWKYSMTNYIGDIQAPLQLHQGSADEAVPQAWNDNFVEQLKEQDKDVTYYVYPQADHNMRPDWGTVIARDVEWLQERVLK